MSDIDSLQGDWHVISLEVDGMQVGAPAFHTAQITLRGDRFVSTGMGADYQGTVELDETAVPKWFTLRFDSGPEQGNANFGIYELSGDLWRICLAMKGSLRPTKFATAPGAGIALEVLRRGPASAPAGPAPAPGSEGVPFEPAPELQGEWRMLSGSLDGHPLDKRMINIGRRIVNGSETKVTFGDYLHSQGQYTVDRTQTPHGIDIHNTGGAVQLGIYEHTGETLRLSIAATGAPRPTDFSSSKGDGRTVVSWTRA
jgi:uncharacterized protein (TIGR03067 family)